MSLQFQESKRRCLTAVFFSVSVDCMKTDFIEPWLYGKIFHVMRYDNALALRVSLETGLRIGDVLALTPENIKGTTIYYVAQKTGKAGKKQISAELAEKLRKISTKKFVFCGRSGDKPRTRQAVWKDVKRASKIVGIDVNAGCHSARKTYAVDLYEKSGLQAVQKELQHDRQDTSMIYALSDVLTNKRNTKGKDVDYNVLADMIADRVYTKLLPLFEKCSIDK